jgi:predicted acylesterase/phospholipase RssA
MPRNCDFVSKGGVAEAIVELAAAAEIAKTFRFCNIGGSSMGAISAALVAAAEFRRARNGSTDGFNRFDGIARDLARPGSMLRLFTPRRSTRYVAKTLVSTLGQPRFFSAWAEQMLASPRSAVLGALPGLSVLVAILLGENSGSPLHVLALCVAVAIIVAGAYLVTWFSFFRTFANAVARNNYGIATGMDETDRQDKSTLSAWLANELELTAGLPPGHVPLTFAMLWDPTGAVSPLDLQTRPGAAEINLQLVSTDLTFRAPFTFPARLPMYFDPGEFRMYFPDHVVDWMISRSRPPRDATEAAANADAEKQRLLPLPLMGDLPIVVAARISASLPILLSAVPMYARDFSVAPAPGVFAPLERHWFCDGSVTSNASLAMFDAPLPRWPTFAFNFAPFPPHRRRSEDAAQNVYMPPSNTAGMFPTIARFTTLIDLIVTLLDAQRNWADYRLRTLPGYRDRIVTVFLAPEESGLLLELRPEVLLRLQRVGAAAGALISARFEPSSELASHPVAMNWENHRWLRLRTALDAIRQYLGRFGRGFHDPGSGDAPYEELLTATHGIPAERFPLPASARYEVASLAHSAADLGERLAEAVAIRAGLPSSELDVVPANSPPKMDVRPADGSGPVSLLQTETQSDEPPPTDVLSSSVDPPREANALLECRERVVVGEPFTLTVGIGPEHMRARATKADILRRPDSSIGPYTLTVIIIAEGFSLAFGQEWANTLSVTTQDPYPQIELTLTPSPIESEIESALITAIYSVDNQAIGSAWRAVSITGADVDKLLRQPDDMAQMPYVTAIGTASTPADLSVFIIYPKNGPEGSLAWYFLSRHADELPKRAVTSKIGDTPQGWSQRIAGEIEQRPEPERLREYIVNLGSEIGSHMPKEFFDAFRTVQKKAGPYPSVLFLSEDPYIPWELCTVDCEGRETTLGAAARVGRWKLADSALPPPVEKRLDSMAVIHGRYSGRMKLRGADQEMRLLEKRYQAQVYPALYKPIKAALSGQHDVVHFAMHGTSDLAGEPVGLILEEGAPFTAGDIGRNSVRGAFVFLNACQVGRGETLLGDYAGVASALLRGGASGVVAPLWSVVDSDARDFAGAFYDGLTKGLSPAEVLRRYRVSNPSVTTWSYLFYGHPELQIAVPRERATT